MAIIPLRNTVFAARLAKEVSKTSGESLSLSQKLIAALYGYQGWEHLVAAISSTAAPFVFDQDLSEDDLNSRTLEQAQNLTAVFGYALRLSINIAMSVRVTWDRTRPLDPKQPRFYPEAAFNAALVADDDSWWVSKTELKHPLAPPGFDIAVITNDADLSTWRLKQNLPWFPRRSHYTLLPSNARPPFYPFSSHIHARLDDFNRISVVPWSFVFENNKAVSMKREDFWRTRYESADEARKAVREYRKLFASALSTAQDAKIQFVMGQQIPVHVRMLMGNGDPLWPLTLQCETPVQRQNGNDLRHWVIQRSKQH